MNDRLQAVRNKMQGLNLQGMIIANPVNIKYLTKIEAEGILLLTRKENIFITDGRYMEYVSSIITPFDEIVVDDQKNISKDEYENFFLFCENVGFEEKYLSFAIYKDFIRKYKINNFVEAEEIISSLRTIKDNEEIANIKKACEVTDECFKMLLEYIKPGLTEKQIARKIHEFYLDNSEGESFETIVASGENSSKPHAIVTDRVINPKDIITIDMGCKINGYCSDMTRTIFIGEPTQEQKNIYNLVLENQQRALNEMRDGASIKTIVKGVESTFNLQNHTLIHSLGHGVGLEIHEPPIVSLKNDSLLKENMVVTDEPRNLFTRKFWSKNRRHGSYYKERCDFLDRIKKRVYNTLSIFILKIERRIIMAAVYSAGDFRNGTTFEMEGNVYRIVEFQHVKPGKGAAFVRTKLKNVITGAVLEKTFNPGDKFPAAEIENKEMQYLYNDGDLYYFMDNETYDQIPLNKEQLGDCLKYLKENMQVKILSYKGKVFAVEPPIFVELEVTYTEPGFAGNTTTTSGKPATVETGLELQVPMFVNIGDIIRVDTRTCQYMERI